MSKQRNVAEAILEQLSAWDVKYIYGLVGDDIFYLMDALARRNTIKFYQVKHEESAAIMASAQAKLTGETGVCLADGGPGTAHLINGLADAFMDNVPVLAITGQVARKDIGTNKKQYVDQQSLLRPLVSYTGLLCDPAATPQVLENAWRPAVAGRSVSHVSVPMDVLPMPCEAAIIPPAPYLGSHPRSSSEVVQGALELMRKSHRPVILSGAGGRKAGRFLSELSLRWGAAIINTLAGTGVVDRYHPYYVGGLGHAGSPASARLLSQADLCLVVGANWWPQNYVPKDIPAQQASVRRRLFFHGYKVKGVFIPGNSNSGPGVVSWYILCKVCREVAVFYKKGLSPHSSQQFLTPGTHRVCIAYCGTHRQVFENVSGSLSMPFENKSVFWYRHSGLVDQDLLDNPLTHNGFHHPCEIRQFSPAGGSPHGVVQVKGFAIRRYTRHKQITRFIDPGQGETFLIFGRNLSGKLEDLQ